MSMCVRKCVSKRSFSVATASLIHTKSNMFRKASFPHTLLFACALTLFHENSGGDALRGNTRSHPEHDG